MTHRTYHINRSRVLEEILTVRGWTSAATHERATFCMWDSYHTEERFGHIQPMKRHEIHRLDNKRMLFIHLRTRGLAHILPETYLALEHVQLAIKDAPKSLWFVKPSYLSGGRGITCARDIFEIQQAVQTIEGNNYVIQRAIMNPLLIDGCKFTIRSYVLVLEDLTTYLYRESLLIVHPHPFDPVSTNPDVQFRHGSASQRSSTEVDAFVAWYPELKQQVTQVIAAYAPVLNYAREEGRYQLLGFDFIITQSDETHLIEINGWPNLGSINNVFSPVKRRMLEDFATLVTTPRHERSQNSTTFELCLPIDK